MNSEKGDECFNQVTREDCYVVAYLNYSVLILALNIYIYFVIGILS